MKILLCISEMPYAEPTVRFGGLVASLVASSVTILNVIGQENERAEAQKTLAQAQRILALPQVSTCIREGTPAREIIREANEGDYDLLIIGGRDDHRLSEMILGSVTRKVLSQVETSVLVVKGERQQLKRLLICAGGQVLNETVVQMGAQLAHAAQARATLLHVVTPLPGMYTGLGAMEETLPELLQTDTPMSRFLHRGAKILVKAGVTAEVELGHGVPAAEILREGREGDYDLIVVGARILPGRIRRLLVDDVTAQIVDQANRPVLIVQPSASTEDE